MGRAPCCEKVGLKRGRWTAEEDEILINYINQNGEGSWRSLPKNAGLLRCGKSCRLRWINYLRADLKRGNFSVEEEETVIKLHRSVGNRWSLIASHLPGRTDNEVKNYWNSHLSRKIYSFRSGNGSLLNAIDVLKMSSSTCKRRGGRVSRSVAKKYNKATRHNTVNGTQEMRARNVTHEEFPGKKLEVGPTREEVEVESRVNSNSSTTIHDSCREGKEVIWQDSIFGSSKELGGGGDIEVVEPYNQEAIDGTGLVDQFFLSELSDLCKISINNDEKLKGSLVPERTIINDQEWKYEAWHSSLDSGLLEECFSPLSSSSYYIDDMAKFGTTFDASIGFGGLWD